jgi:hypothetical protein
MLGKAAKEKLEIVASLTGAVPAPLHFGAT